jgi:hypothetical protein
LSRLAATLAVVAVLTSVASAQPAPSRAGADVIRALLTSQPRWTLYWDRGDLASPTRDERGLSARVEFMSVGRALVGHLGEDRLLHAECEFEAAVTADGFRFVGCWGPDWAMTYDPDDGEHPFKGRLEGTSLWLSPAR